MTEDLAGCVVAADGTAKPFDDWYWDRFGEEPSRANLRRRVLVRLVAAVALVAGLSSCAHCRRPYWHPHARCCPCYCP